VKILKSVKAISPAFTTVLMVTITITGAIIAYAWAMSYADWTLEKTGHVIAISSVNFAFTGSNTCRKITVYIQNIGEGTVRLTEVFLNDAMVSGDDLTFSVNSVLEEGETCTITIYLKKPVKKGTDGKLKIVNYDGVSAEGTYTVE
jgi:hypothetical protein